VIIDVFFVDLCIVFQVCASQSHDAADCRDIAKVMPLRYCDMKDA